MHRKKTLVGLMGVVGIWVTAGVALPFVNILKDQSPEHLLAARGWITALIAFVMLRGKVLGVDKYTWLIGLCVPFASLGLFKGIREWGAGPTIIVIATTPLVNLVIAWLSGKKISGVPIACFCLILAGIILARWGGTFTTAGLLWSMLAALGSGLLYELFPRAKSTSLHKCFWGSVGIGTIGVIGSPDSSWGSVLSDPNKMGTILIFALVGGFLYWMANLLAFSNLPLEVASILAQGETLAVIISAGILLDEKLSAIQWSGVTLALLATGYLSHWMVQTDKRDVLPKTT